MKVLLADDEELSLTVLRGLVTGMGHEAVYASDGVAAWELYKKGPTRIVISDWKMPGMSGLDLCAKIRAERNAPYTYFVLVTANEPNSENYGLAMKVGVDDFLTKPVKNHEIHGRLRVAERILGLTEALESFVSICSYCKKIRKDDGSYEPVEAFINRRSKTAFSHGICPVCLAKETGR